jgi:hypothetical protein
VTLLPTHDVTLSSYPRITWDVPREIASQYRDGEFGLALWNSGEKDSKYRLAVAEQDTNATPPPMAVHQVAAVPTPAARASATAVPSPGASGSIRPGTTPGGTPTPSVAPTLPPQRLLFAGTATALKLVANRPAVFALYALPHPSGSPVPKASGGATTTTLTRTSGSAASSAPATLQSSSAPPTSPPTKSP